MKITLENCQKIFEQFIPPEHHEKYHKEIILNLINLGIKNATTELEELSLDESSYKNAEYIFSSIGLHFSANINKYFIFKIKFHKKRWHLKWFTTYHAQDYPYHNLFLTEKSAKIAHEKFLTKFETLPAKPIKPIPTSDKGEK